jgi:sugar O-acyltransferase (sialic acid O-acetyltransferase NeuD family)
MEELLAYTTAQAFINDSNWKVLGQGGFAKEVRGLLWQLGIKATETFIDDDKITTPISIDDILVVGIGEPALKKKFADKFYKHYFPNIIAKDSIADIEMGIGNVICNGNIFTVDISIRNFNAVNLNCTIGHDVRIGNYNQINPAVNISGRVTIGNECLIGVGAIILERLTICSNVIIGAGAVVTKDITEPGIYIGIPARKIK